MYIKDMGRKNEKKDILHESLSQEGLGIVGSELSKIQDDEKAINLIAEKFARLLLEYHNVRKISEKENISDNKK